jgi:hypothetical protein
MHHSTGSMSSLEDYLFHPLPQDIIKEDIFQMLDLSDIACLEVAAAVHRIHDYRYRDR